MTFAASKLFADRYLPFVFGGYSDGNASQMEADLGVGLGFAFNTRRRAARDVLAIGFNWGSPSNGTYQDQYTTELFWRYQLTRELALTPAQLGVCHRVIQHRLCCAPACK